MQVQLMQCASENNVIRKKLSTIQTVNCLFKEESSIINPVIILDYNLQSMSNVNYMYIPTFDRYYYMQDIRALTGGRYMVTGKLDVLQSFASDILSLLVVVDKQKSDSKSDLYIDDGSFVTENRLVNNIYNFPNGFNDNGEFILITVGG